MNKLDIHVGDYVWFNKRTICSEKWNFRSPELICEVLAVDGTSSPLIRPIDSDADPAPDQSVCIRSSWIREDGSFLCHCAYLAPCNDPDICSSYQINLSSLL